MFGSSMTKVDCLSLSATQIQDALRAERARYPNAPYILGKQMLYDTLDAKPHRAILDAVIPDIPVIIDSADLHSAWLNTKALEAMGITSSTPDPPGGVFEKDEQGELTGFFLETAVFDYVWPYIASLLSLEDRINLLDKAFEAYLATGVTGLVDMAMEEKDLVALEEYHRRKGLPVRVAAHWIIKPAGTSETRVAQVQEAATHRARLNEQWGEDTPISMAGIKIMSDGVVDSCTAYLSKPYADGTTCGPIWAYDAMEPIVTLADSLGLQVAVHALGDAASAQALDAFEHAIEVNGLSANTNPRFRCEHLEVVSEESIARLTRLGVVASLQPSHADPVYAPTWRAMLGEDERADRGFCWSEFAHAGSHVAFGSDAPVAPHHVMPNLYTATTRRSAVDPTYPPPTDPKILRLDRLTIKLETAIRYYTAGSAYSIRQSHLRGSLEAGKYADFCVLAIDPFLNGVETLREAQEGVEMTYFKGKMVWSRGHVDVTVEAVGG